LRCEETRELIHAYADGELDLVKSMEIEKHLQACDDCAEAHQAIRTLSPVIGDRAVRFDPPANLERRLQSALRRENRTQRKSFTMSWRWLWAVTSFVVVIGVVWAVAASLNRRSQNDLLAQEIVSSHVRSLMADHLTDVPSSDQHTVKPWFAGKLDFSPPVKDLAPQGFSLNGGRLDYIGHRPVAALVYQRRQHSINVFIWPSTDSAAMNESAASHGYNVIRWSQAGMAYWVVSDLNLDELRQFVRLLQEQNGITS
jgi:anti-sigma factor RsiW